MLLTPLALSAVLPLSLIIFGYLTLLNQLTELLLRQQLAPFFLPSFTLLPSFLHPRPPRSFYTGAWLCQSIYHFILDFPQKLNIILFTKEAIKWLSTYFPYLEV